MFKIDQIINYSIIWYVGKNENTVDNSNKNKKYFIYQLTNIANDNEVF